MADAAAQSREALSSGVEAGLDERSSNNVSVRIEGSQPILSSTGEISATKDDGYGVPGMRDTENAEPSHPIIPLRGRGRPRGGRGKAKEPTRRSTRTRAKASHLIT